jgi:hypothetical protein
MNWKYIEEYGRRYMIKTDGTVVSLTRKIGLKNGRERLVKTKTIKPRVNNCGYLSIRLSKDGVCKTHFVHRLIAQAFIPNPDNHSQVNHISGDKLDNRIENLEWVTSAQNAKHAYDTGLNSNKGVNHTEAQPIFDKESGETFDTIRQMSLYYGINYNTLRNALNGYSEFPINSALQKNYFYKISKGEH